MAYRGSLVERLSSAHTIHAVDDEDALCQSVANNLSRIFATNAGNSESVPDYGRPDLNNIQVSQQESFDLIEKSLEKCIHKYEPRLLNARIGLAKERLGLNEMHLYVEGLLHIGGVSKKVQFKANLFGSGTIEVMQNDH